MPRYEAEVRTTFSLPVAPEVARQHYASLEAIAAATHGVERYQTAPDGVIAFEFLEQDHKIAKFKGHYQARYALDGDRIIWDTLREMPHNSGTSGEATFAPAEGGCAVTYREAVFIDLEVPVMVAAVLRPVIAKVLEGEVNGYLKRMRETLPTS